MRGRAWPRCGWGVCPAGWRTRSWPGWGGSARPTPGTSCTQSPHLTLRQPIIRETKHSTTHSTDHLPVWLLPGWGGEGEEAEEEGGPERGHPASSPAGVTRRTPSCRLARQTVPPAAAPALLRPPGPGPATLGEERLQTTGNRRQFCRTFTDRADHYANRHPAGCQAGRHPC